MAVNFNHGECVGGKISVELATWYKMRSRCLNPKNKDYMYYGGRGIRVCDRWLFGADGLSGVECFILDMGRRPSNQHSIDRYPDGDGNYDPTNCRWATRKQQTEGEAWRRKIKAHQKRLHADPGWRKAVSLANRGNKHCLGYRHPPEVRAEMSRSRLGKKRGPYKPSSKPRGLAAANKRRNKD